MSKVWGGTLILLCQKLRVNLARIRAVLHHTPYTLHTTLCRCCCASWGGPRPTNPTPYTLHPAPYTLHPTPYTQHPTPTPYTLHPSPYTLRPAPCTLHPAPCIQHPTPYTLHPTPFTLLTAPYTLHPTPNTLHPAPYTLHPAPYILHPTSSVSLWCRANSVRPPLSLSLSNPSLSSRLLTLSFHPISILSSVPPRSSRAIPAHVRQSRPDYGLRFLAKVVETF